MKFVKAGRIIIPDGAYPEDHEIETARVLIKSGKDIEFLVPVRTNGAQTPDVTWNNIDWELKSPRGKGKRLLDNTIRRAQKQSPNIIVDLRRVKLKDRQVIDKLSNNPNILRGVKRLKAITKGDEVVDIK